MIINIIRILSFCFFLTTLNAQTWNKLGTGTDETVIEIAINSDNQKVFVSYFSRGINSWNNMNWEPIWELNKSWVYFESNKSIDGAPRSIGFYNNDFLAGGNFQIYDSTTNTSSVPLLVSWDGIWSDFSPGNSGNVYCMDTDQSTNDLYVAGFISQIGNLTVNHIAKWDGQTWSTLGNGVNDQIETMYFDNNSSKLYIGGKFTMAGGEPANGIAEWNGVEWSSIGNGIENTDTTDNLEINTISVYDNDVYVGGRFNKAGNISVDNFAKWDGLKWENIATGLNHDSLRSVVNASCVYAGELYIGGKFNNIDNRTFNNIARWNGTEWKALGNGIEMKSVNNEIVHALNASQNELYVGGRFDTVDNIPAKNIAKWTMPPISIEEQELQNLQLTLSPNPVYSNQQITLKRSKANEAGILNLYDLNGKLLQSIRLPVGEKHSIFNLKATSGVYLYQYHSTENPKINKSGKLVLLK